MSTDGRDRPPSDPAHSEWNADPSGGSPTGIKEWAPPGLNQRPLPGAGNPGAFREANEHSSAGVRATNPTSATAPSAAPTPLGAAMSPSTTGSSVKLHPPCSVGSATEQKVTAFWQTLVETDQE